MRWCVDRCWVGQPHLPGREVLCVARVLAGTTAAAYLLSQMTDVRPMSLPPAAQARMLSAMRTSR